LDWPTIILAAIGVIEVLIAGYVRFVQGQIDKARADAATLLRTLTDFQIKVAENYVTHTDLRRIEDALVRIEAKMDVKADK
jgi:hypothetical protein